MGKIKAKNKVYLDGFYKLGIFTAFLLLTVFSVWLYSPVIKSHADDSATSQVEVNVNTVLSMVLSTDELDFLLQPTSYGNTQQENYIDATIHTNNTSGFQLYFSSIDNSTDMVSDESEEAIESLTLQNTNLSVPNGKGGVWGYKTAQSDPWDPIPTVASPTIIKNSLHPSSAGGTTTKVYIGIAVNTSLDAGLYSKDVKFSSIVSNYAETSPLTNITYMQEMTTSICNNTPVGAVATLTDNRDGKEYKIQKLEDNECWMIQDLRLTGPITIDSSDSDVESEFTLPETRTAEGSWSYEDEVAISKVYSDYYLVGNTTAYNYYAASAGTVFGSENYDDAVVSLCPKGWKLPSESQWSTFAEANDITDDENGYNVAMSAPFNFSKIPSEYGNYDNHSTYNSYAVALYWSANSWNTYSDYRTSFEVSNRNGYSADIGLHRRSYAASIRCVAR